MSLSYPEAFELSVKLHRSSQQRYSETKGVLNIFVKFTGKYLSQSLFLRPEDLQKSNSVTDFKNILQANHKDTRITFLKHFFFLFEYVFVCWSTSISNRKEEFGNNPIYTFGNVQGL